MNLSGRKIKNLPIFSHEELLVFQEETFRT